jgi:uncharacterized Tic20 family protein
MDMGQFARAWQLTKLSWHVIRTDKSLLAFPIISGTLSIIAFIMIVAPFMLFIGMDTMFEDNGLLMALMFILVYFVIYFLAIFFQVATIACAMHVMDGNNTTVAYGIRFAASKVKYILQWAVISTVVGFILSRIRQAGFIGGLISIFAGLAWGIATFFVVPVMVFEDVGPFEGIKRSVKLVKSTLGPTLISNLSIGLIFMLLFLLGFVVFIPLVVLLSSSWLALGPLIGLVVYTMVILVLGSLISKVLIAVLYRYAMTGKAYMEVDRVLMQTPGFTPIPKSP